MMKDGKAVTGRTEKGETACLREDREQLDSHQQCNDRKDKEQQDQEGLD